MNKNVRLAYDTLVTLALMAYSIVMCVVRLIVPYKYRSKSIQGEICMVTGSGSGIGKLMAKKFAKLGARLILVDRNEKDNQQTLSEILVDGGEAKMFTCDLSSRDEIYKLAEEVCLINFLTYKISISLSTLIKTISLSLRRHVLNMFTYSNSFFPVSFPFRPRSWTVPTPFSPFWAKKAKYR